jgi:hypothetical protein
VYRRSNIPSLISELSVEERVFFRHQFRLARAKAQSDAEAFDEVLFCLERLGLRLTGTVGTLGIYKVELEKAAQHSPLAQLIPTACPAMHTAFPALYEELRDARNAALHQGAFARLLTHHAIQVALIIEDALMSAASLVSQFMVRDAIEAQPWQPVSFVRQQMLTHSFSFLPLWHTINHSEGWYFISETAVARYLRQVSAGEERNSRLATSVSDAITAGLLKATPTEPVRPDLTITQAVERLNGIPLVVADPSSPEVLLGIVTAFDVL